MASTYTTNNGIELIATGEKSGTWGDTTNTNLEIIDRLTSGVGAISLSGTTYTLTTSQTGQLSEGHYSVLVFGGSPSGTNTVTISPNDQQKVFIVKNNSGESIVLTQGSGGNVTIEDGDGAIVYADGAGATAEVVDVSSTFSGGITGPASSTDNGVVLFDGTTGEIIQDSASQDGVIHGLTIGRGASGVATNVVFGGNSAGASITTASSATLVGSGAGASLTTGIENVAVGKDALGDNTTGPGNVAIGALAMAESGTPANPTFGISNNVMIGRYCGQRLTGFSNVGVGYAAIVDASGYQNTAVGNVSLSGITSGNGNSALGYQSGQNVTTGDENTCVGYLAGGSITTGDNNLCLGNDSGRSSSPFEITTESNRVVVGDSNISNAYIQVAWTVTSDARDKVDVAPVTHGLDLIDLLNPVTFKWDKRSKYFVYDEDGNIIDRPAPDGTHKEEQPFAGFVAQEVQQAVESSGFADNIIVDKEQDDLWKIKETALIPILVKAVQELKARVEELEARV